MAKVPSDLEIARAAKPIPITEIAAGLGLDESGIDTYGKYKAKVHLDVIKKRFEERRGNLILVSAMTPTPAGEGKTTTSIGLAMGLNKLGQNAILALREPSLGPTMGMKGGAACGGYSQVVPSVEPVI